MQCPVSVV